MTTIQPDYTEHALSLLSVSIWVIGGLLSVVGILLLFEFRNFRASLKDLFDRVKTTETKVAYLTGAHEARTGLKISCSVERED